MTGKRSKNGAEGATVTSTGITALPTSVPGNDLDVQTPTANEMNDPDNQSFVSQTVTPSRSCVFHRLLFEALMHLGIYIHKLSQDSIAVKEYWNERQWYTLLVSVLCLVLPSIVYSVYTVLSTVLQGPRVTFGKIASRFIQGILLIPWQIKSHVEVLHFASEKIGHCRSLTSSEKDVVSSLKQDAFVLEFFEDFYAGFIQLILQMHLVLEHLDSDAASRVLYGEIIGSTLAVYSLIKAIQRRDDGLLTRTLSYLGWISNAACRVIAVALAADVIGGFVVIGCLLHACGFTWYQHRIIVEAQQNIVKASTSLSESNQPPPQKPKATLVATFFLFGIPSLVFWPIMFDFKKVRHVATFLGVTAVENLLCLGIWFLGNRSSEMKHQHVLLAVFGGAFLLSLISISLYVCCKPKRTDQVVLVHIREQKTNKYGIFYDFCKAVNMLPHTEQVASDLEKLRQMNLIE